MTETTTAELDLAGLRRIAEAATPGPWLSTWDEGDERFDITGQPHNGMMCPVAAHADQESSAAHIAAFDPPTVLALLNHIASLEARPTSEFIEEVAGALRETIDQLHAVERERDALQARLDAFTDDQLVMSNFWRDVHDALRAVKGDPA